MKLNYIFIPLVVFLITVIGGALTRSGMEWYKSINLPAFTPPGYVIGIVWTIIFILGAVSALIVWNSGRAGSNFKVIIIIFILNGLLNLLWSYLFFNVHFIGAAVVEAGLLGISVFALVILIWPVSVAAAILLLPYGFWVAFATYLTYMIFLLNK